jgi:PAS domain S-box-containing protein
MTASLPASTPAPSLPSQVDEAAAFRALFSAYPDAVLLVDGTGRIVLANPQAASLLGYSVEELAGLHVEVLVPDAIRPRHASFREAYGKAPRARPMGTQMDLVARRKDGSEVMVEIALSPLHEQGLPYIAAAIRGIEAYPRVQQALRRARYAEHLALLGRLAVDTLDAKVLLRDAPVMVAAALEADSAMVVLLEHGHSECRIAGGVGLGEAEQIGTRLPDWKGRLLGQAIERGEPVAALGEDAARRLGLVREEPRLGAPGFRCALAVPLSDRGRSVGGIVVRCREERAFGTDEIRFLQAVASLVATSLQRAQSGEALNHSQRLESVGQLTGGIAHDFNNLLTIIQGNLQVLREMPALDGLDYEGELVEAAMRAARRGAELTAKLLAFSRRQVLQPSAIDAAAMLDSLAEMLRRTLDQRIVIEVDVPADGLLVLADAGQLESALLNMAINARDAMPGGGRLRFRAAVCEALPAPVRSGLDDPDAADGSFVAISVSDTGVGMSDEVRERAFEPFFTTKDVGRGTGLGLSTVYGFARQSRGAVALDTEPGQGTTITLYIPKPRSEAEPVAAADAASRLPPGLQVLLVEDDAEVRKVAKAILEALGCRVLPVATAEQALALLATDARFDVLLSDIALGAGMRGTQLATLAQQQRAGLKVVLMSGFSRDLLEGDRDAAARWELLRKPYTREELGQAIVRVLM